MHREAASTTTAHDPDHQQHETHHEADANMRPSVARALLRGPAQASARAACQAAFSPCHSGVAPGMRVAAPSALPGTTRTFMKRRSVEEKTLPFETPPSFAFSFE